MYYCEECGEPMVYCNGQIRKSYFRHYPGSTCSSGGGESNFHLLAKNIIKEVLEGGEEIEVCRKCHFCFYQETHSIKLEERDMVSLEYRDGNSIYDLAIVNGETVKSVVEVFHTHRQRRDIPFLEVRAMDVIHMENNLLDDCRTECPRCDIRNSGPIIQRFCYQLDICSTYDGISFEETNKTELIERLRQIAVHGRCDSYVKEYYSGGFKRDAVLWRELISYNRCVHRFGRESISMYKPYCLECYVTISHMEFNTTKRGDLEEYKPQLRFIFNRVMNEFPRGKNRRYDICKKCNLTPCDNIWYMSRDGNNYRHVCYRCLLDSSMIIPGFRNIMRNIHDLLASKGVEITEKLKSAKT